MKHPQIRKAVLDALIAVNGNDATWFDGRPAAFEVGDLPAVAVYITDAQHTDEPIDEDGWNAMLNIEVILGAAVTDTELDNWMEKRIYPALENIPALIWLIEKISPVGYEYQRDDEVMVWSSATISYSIAYIM